MTGTRVKRIPESGRGGDTKRRRCRDIDSVKSRLAARAIEAEKSLRAARKARVLDTNRKAQAEKRRPRRDEKMAMLRSLLDVVLEVEPWNSARHISKVGEAWEECGRRVPGFLKEGARSEPRLLVQQQIFRLGEQLNDPTARTPWKSYPEVRRGVEGVVAKLAATRRYGRKFGLHQQQAGGGSQKLQPGDGGNGASSPGTARDGTAAPAAGAVEPTKSNLATVETAHASREQPPTAHQRQQQGPEKPEKSYILRLAFRSYSTAAEQVSTTAVAC